MIEQVRGAYRAGHRRVLVVSPTGSGKTIVFAAIARGVVERGRRALILGHRQEIVDQIGDALAGFGIEAGFIAAVRQQREAPVTVASVQALSRRLESVGHVDLIVIDEAHHAVAGSWRKIAGAFPRARILGVTATPLRLDGRGLGDAFDYIVEGPSVAELIAGGFLVRPTIFTPARSPDLSRARIVAGDFRADDLAGAMGGIVISSAVTEYERLCPGAPAVAFAVDRKHSLEVAAAFRSRGFRAAHVDGDTPRQERRRLIASLGSGAIDVVSNCGLISEGVDIPNVRAAILLRPTASIGLYLQQVGRALRPAPGKNRALILDFAGNVDRHGPPDLARAWSLDSRPPRGRPAANSSGLRRCASCGAMNPRARPACSECAADLPISIIERREIEARLAEDRRSRWADEIAGMSGRDRRAWAGDDRQRLEFLRATLGYKRGWIAHAAREWAIWGRGRAKP